MTEEYYISLIVKELNKNISLEEKSKLKDWLSVDLNKELYNSMLKNWDKAELYKSTYKANKNLAWQKIQNKISIEETVTEKKIVAFNFKKALKIAATVIVLLGLTFFIKDSFTSNSFVNIQTAKNETKDVILPDGTKIFLNENSSIQYAKNFIKRNIELKGEAFFEVAKDTEHPFIITADETETQVLGTSFNVEINENNVEVILFTGKVKFSNTKNNSVILNPGDIATYNKQSSSFFKRNTTIENKNYWKTKKLNFENTNISDVVLSLENYYNVDIEFNSANKNCVFTGTFDDAKVENVLEVLSYSLNTSFYYNDDKYIINNFDCK